MCRLKAWGRGETWWEYGGRDMKLGTGRMKDLDQASAHLFSREQQDNSLRYFTLRV